MLNIPISEDDLDTLTFNYRGHVYYADDEADHDLGSEISQRIRESEVDDTHPQTDSGMDF